MADFEPQLRPIRLSLRLVMERSLTKAELREFDLLDADEALDRARGMKTLHCEWSSVGEIANLEPFEAAEVLYLQHNRIQRIQNLDSVPRLQFLALQGNQISVVENLDCLRELEFLDLAKNQIAVLDERQLPKTVNMLNLQGNPCAEVHGYRERLQDWLPDLLRLDGKDLVEHDASLLEPITRPAAGTEVTLLSTEKGLGAYWRKGEMQTNAEADIKGRIDAFSMEALADVAGFDTQVGQAKARSVARREGLDCSWSDAAANSSRPGTARRLLEAVSGVRPPSEPELLS